MERGDFLQRHGRVLSFALVLILSSALTLLLFRDARAVEISLAAPETASAGETLWIHANVTIPPGQRLPLRGTQAVLETIEGREKVLLAQATCSRVEGCVTDSLLRGGPDHRAIVEIAFLSPDVAPTFGPLRIEHRGYGYSALEGHGYEVDPVRRSSATDIHENGSRPGYGWGYGQDDEAVTLRFAVAIDGAAVPPGAYWVTFLLDTGSAVLGTVSSPAEPIALRPAPGGPAAGNA